MNPWAILDGYGGEGCVVVRPSMIHHLGASAAILLAQFLYWQRRTKDANGWFWNTQESLQRQTGLSDEAQLTARKKLKAIGFLEEEKRGLPASLYFRLNLDLIAAECVKISQEFEAFFETESPRKQESENHGNSNPRTTETVIRGYGETVIREPRILYKETKITEEITEKITSSSTLQDNDYSADALKTREEHILELQEQALENLRQVPVLDKHWFGSIPNNHQAKYYVLAHSLEVFNFAVMLAKNAKPVSTQTFAVWLEDIKTHMKAHGVDAVVNALKATLRTPLERPRNSFEFYVRCLENAAKTSPPPIRGDAVPDAIDKPATPWKSQIEKQLEELEAQFAQGVG
jgi:hypothetical protein